MKTDVLLVSIICHTYNQENYIKDTIDGFLMQKTNFLYEIIIHDDASTDCTKKIIESYVSKFPEKFVPVYQAENQFSKKKDILANFTYPKAKGKYIAVCEGDDYWTDEYKLQKQVDFLENNPDYVVTWTNFVSKHEKKYIETGFEEDFPEIYAIDLNNIFETYITYTLTVVFKRDAIDYLRILDMKYVKDNTLYALLLSNGKGAFMNFKSAVHIWHEGGVYSLKSDFFKRYSSYLNVREIYETIAPAKTAHIKNIYKGLLRISAFEALKIYFNKNEKDKKFLRKIMKEFFTSTSLKYKFKFINKFVKYKLGIT